MLAVKAVSRLLYRYDIRWIAPVPEDRWADVRLVLLLHHTSLYEPLFAGFLPTRFLKSLAFKGLVPVADKTFNRPLAGRFYKNVAGTVIPLSRSRDDTWTHFLDRMRPDAMIVMAPEGRMKRADGLDAAGMPMTIRGGVAELIERIPDGRMLIAYSGGLHHVQVPGQTIPRIFKTLSMQIENLAIDLYRTKIIDRCGAAGFKQGVIRDLEARRLKYCGC